MSTPQTPRLGEVFFQRREAVGVSQAELAWLARVSRNTISNLERGKGASQNTIRNVARVLGGDYWDFLSWESRAHEQATDEVYDYEPMDPAGSWLILEEQVRAVLRVIIRSRGDQPRVARGMADAWMNYNSALADLQLPMPSEAMFERAAEERQDSFNALRRDLVPCLLGAEDEGVVSWLEDNGWTPEDDLPAERQAEAAVQTPTAGEQSGGTASLALEDMFTQFVKAWETKAIPTSNVQTKSDAFSKLPMLVQNELMANDVGNAVVDHPGGAPGVTHILLTLTNENSPRFDQKKALDSLGDALCANRIALDVMYKFDDRQPTLDEVVDTVRAAMWTYGAGRRSDGWNLDTERYGQKESSDGSTE
ncbi:helix-turn-helix domain-containing protein [Nocardiopsis sp. EMB25]|uniref:helix-turn-helix transcriptional regulator n=1 Tax=Nocardiopsis sp. EMB25 TaxID=2835867 RepID=UPI0022837526|nr:helix-turn-helix transcriptional regulator [Nocardiopsis sp. EMB25]MCY9786861.1 helix-turn-helix domain-containing protein [Nocardiopsis sp. EMB25]